MNINGRYITKNAIKGYHWYQTSCLFRTYFILDLIDGSRINILYEDGVGEKYNQNLVSKIIEFVKS